MTHHINRKLAAVVLTVGLVIGAGGVAYAYFTSGGSGSSTASVGTAGASDFTLSSAGPTGDLYPGSAPSPFDVSALNGGTTDEYIGTVYLSVASDPGTGDAETTGGVPIPDCLASWFTVTPSIALDQTVAPGDSVSTSGLDLTLPGIQMTESGTDQSACEGGTVLMDFSTVSPV
jgi:hypothetical protein